MATGSFADGAKLVNLTGTKWVVHEGTLKLYTGDVFSGAAVFSPIVLEAHEDGVLKIGDGGRHAADCAVGVTIPALDRLVTK